MFFLISSFLTKDILETVSKRLKGTRSMLNLSKTVRGLSALLQCGHILPLAAQQVLWNIWGSALANGRHIKKVPWAQNSPQKAQAWWALNLWIENKRVGICQVCQLFFLQIIPIWLLKLTQVWSCTNYFFIKKGHLFQYFYLI